MKKDDLPHFIKSYTFAEIRKELNKSLNIILKDNFITEDYVKELNVIINKQFKNNILNTEVYSNFIKLYDSTSQIDGYKKLINEYTKTSLDRNINTSKYIHEINYQFINDFSNSLFQYSSLITDAIGKFDLNALNELYEKYQILDIDNLEDAEINVPPNKLSISEKWEMIKKSKYFMSFRFMLVFILFLASPVIDKTKEATLDVLGINEFWEESGVYDWLDELFNNLKEN